VGEGQASGADAVQRRLLQQRDVGDEGVPGRPLERPSAGGRLQALQFDEVAAVALAARVDPGRGSGNGEVDRRRDRAEGGDWAQAD
jgi:hypothetical protein